jgi:4-hydroxy-3-polyprenylbenzoate decarboxylase
MVNTIDPDTGIRNMGMYRMQRFDAHTTGMHWHVHKTGARHHESYKRRGERMPVVVTLGGDPVYTYCATAPMPDNMDEYLLAGFLRRKAVRLVKALTCDIRIPEDCDFVIEGYVDPAEEKVVEGDFGDHTGFYSLKDLYPRFHITTITHRRGAVYPATVVGVPPQEDAYISEATEKIFLAPIRLAIQPEIEDLWMPVEGTSHNIAVISIAKRYEAQAAKVAQAMWGAGQMMFNKYMVITLANQCSVRSYRHIGELLRRADVSRCLVRAEGVLDVLDHATATCGVGGKLAFDLTDVDLQSDAEHVAMPDCVEMTDGIALCNDSFAKSCALLVLFAEKGRYDDIDVEAFLAHNNIIGIRYVALFDYAASLSLKPSDLLWIAAANTDPRRDVRLEAEKTLLFDARSKSRDVEGNPRRFPNVVCSSERVIHLVDSRWKEYGLGEFIPSPSLRYRTIKLSDKAEW